MWRTTSAVHPAKNDATGMRPDRPADQVEQRRLAGAVRTDDRRDRVRLGSERHSVDRADAAKRHPEIADFENRRHRAPPPSRPSIRGLTRPSNPFGRKITTAMNSRPIAMRWFSVIEPITDLSSVRITPPYNAPASVPTPPITTVMTALPEVEKNKSSGDTKPRNIG